MSNDKNQSTVAGIFRFVTITGTGTVIISISIYQKILNGSLHRGKLKNSSYISNGFGYVRTIKKVIL